MITAQEVERKLMDYFVAVGGDRARLFSVRDFDTQVMMNAFAPDDRAMLQQAISSLVAANILAPFTRTDWQLTPKGLEAIRAAKESRRVMASTGRLAPKGRTGRGI